MGVVRRWVIIISIVLVPSISQADILNLRAGLGTMRQRDRDTRDSIQYFSLLLAGSYRTPSLDIALELPFRWETRTREFDSDLFNRKGDILRPVKLLRYRSKMGQWSGGLEVLDGWTPGEGILVRELSGSGEIDYILPGIRFTWESEDLTLDAGTDRPVDPTVQAAAITWNIFDGITLILEGAVDPNAPEAFTGRSTDGRPVADVDRRLTAAAAGIRFDLISGDVLALDIGAHAAGISGDAEGAGGELSATLDFSPYYTNRLKLKAGSIACKGGYVPAWFDAPYQLQRWGPEGLPFLALNPLDGTIPDRTMFTYGIDYDLGDFLSISTRLDRFTDDSLRRASFKAQLREDNGRGLELSAWSQTDDPDITLFTEDSDLHSRASALYNFLPHFLLNVSYEHSWAFSEEEAAFKPLNSIMLGVMYDISL